MGSALALGGGTAAPPAEPVSQSRGEWRGLEPPPQPDLLPHEERHSPARLQVTASHELQS